MNKYIGLDIDAKKIVACVVQNGKEDEYATIDSDIASLRKYLRMQKKDKVPVNATFEISGSAGYIYDQIYDEVDDLQIVNPHKATWIYRTNKKNDKIDARKMARLYQFGELPTVHMPKKEIRDWRRTILHRQKIVNKVTRIKNQIRALLKGEGYFKPLYSGGMWKMTNRQWLAELSQSDSHGILWRMQLEDLLSELQLQESNRDRTTEYLDGILLEKPGGELLMSIPGIGPRTAEAVLAYTDDIERFSSAKKYCAYFGLTPRLDESGSTRRVGHISKTGPAIVRWALCEASWRAIRYSPALATFYTRVMSGQKGRKKIAIVAVARKLLTIMRAMQKSGETFNEELLAQTLEHAI